MDVLSLTLLGPPAVRHGGQQLKFRSRKALALLAYLATEGGLSSREKLVALFWPESPEARGRTALRSTLAYLKRPLAEVAGKGEKGEPPYLLIEGDSLGFNFASEHDLDLCAVRSASDLARGLSQDGAHREALDRLQAAVGRYRGDFLEGFSLEDAPEFDHWADVEREAWRRRADSIFDRLSRLRMEAGEAEEAAAVAERWTAVSRSREAAHRRLMEARLQAGDREGALDAYEICRSILGGDLGIEPGPETEALAARVRVEGPVGAPRPAPRAARLDQGAPELLDLPFVGRSPEFGALVSAYHEARSSGARAAAVVGEAGIGKTRLAEEFLRWAQAEGADVLRGQTLGADERPPYGTLVGPLRKRIDRERAPDDLLPDAWLSELSRLLPELKERYPDLPAPVSNEATARAGLFEAVARLVGALAGRAPVVLFVDDAHRADAASLDLLRYAARRWAEDRAPVLLLVGARPEAPEDAGPKEGFLADLGRNLPVVRLFLGPLGVEDTAKIGRALAGRGEGRADLGSERFGRWLHEETGGQPSFLAETLKALLDRDLLVPGEGADGERVVEAAGAAGGVDALGSPLPRGVRDLIRARLERLGPVALTVLAAGAVLGREFSFENLCRVAGVDEDECLAALDEALRGNLLREAGAAYSFVHDNVRRVAYAESGAARRRVFHRRALEALEAAPAAPPAELARHALAAGLAEKAFGHLLAAGDAAMELSAVRDAASCYERARRLLDTDGAGGRELWAAFLKSEPERLYTRLGEAYEFAGEWGRARSTYEAMLTAAGEVGEPSLKGIALVRLAALAARGPFDLATAGRMLEEAGRVSGESGDRAVLASVEVGLAQAAVHSWDPERALAHAERSLVLARELGLAELAARGLYALACARAVHGDWESASAYAAQARASYAALGEGPGERRAMEAESLEVLAVGEVHAGRPRAGVGAAREALAVGLEANDARAVSDGSAVLAFGLAEVGEYEEALRVAEQGTARTRGAGCPHLPLRLAALGAALQAVLRLDDAREAYRKALRLAGAGKPLAASALSGLCANRALAGDWGGARACALKAARVRKKAPAALILGDFGRPHETEALLRGGDVELAREDARSFGWRVGANRRYRITYLRSLAVLARWDGEPDRAVEHLREAALLARDIGLPGELWQAEAGLGDLFRDSGDEGRARRWFARAAETVEALAGKIGDEALRAGFVGAPHVRRVLEGRDRSLPVREAPPPAPAPRSPLARRWRAGHPEA